MKIKKPFNNSNQDKGNASSPDSVFVSSKSEENEELSKLKFDYDNERQTQYYNRDGASSLQK